MISGFFIPGQPQPLIWMALVVDELGPDAALVPFIVDTGAARTCLHALDALRYFGATPADLDPATWRNPIKMGGIGGSVLCKESPAAYGLRRDDGQTEVVTGSILIGDMKTSGMPSLLGWDLLRLFHLEVHGGNLTLRLTRL